MAALKAREGEEIWETTTDGRVWLTMVDDRGRDVVKSVGGKVGDRIRIKTTDREIMQDNVEDGPFSNGMLKRVDSQAKPEDNSPQALTTDELMVGFTKSGKAFHSWVAALNEMNVRRMRDMAEAVDATASQIAHLDTVIKEKFRVEGDTETYRTLKTLGDVR
jgi:hypothetical protein